MGAIDSKAVYEMVNRREVYRYLGIQGQMPDKSVCALVEEVLLELMQCMKPRTIYKVYDCDSTVDKLEKQRADIGLVKLYYAKQENPVMVIKSRNLADNLYQCTKVVLMAATLGVNVDKLLQRYEIINMAKASIAQACGAACIEACCNLLQEQIRQQAAQQGLYLRPRFSAGYGDLPLETQKDIFAQLECTKRIGLTLTQSLLMLPTKSVTAFIGITENNQGCYIGKCASCDKVDCAFREM